eukprot:GHVP01017285.1.p1 GENE.GHVP01017285.1~~GHVP01017285.1.p1  ORF type:complete len:173 (-),score=20.79 GHVP01017285.1:1226-1744(-)
MTLLPGSPSSYRHESVVQKKYNRDANIKEGHKMTQIPNEDNQLTINATSHLFRILPFKQKDDPGTAAEFLTALLFDGYNFILSSGTESKSISPGPFVSGDLSFGNAGSLSTADSLFGLKLPTLFALNANKHAQERFSTALQKTASACHDPARPLMSPEHLPSHWLGLFLRAL